MAALTLGTLAAAAAVGAAGGVAANAARKKKQQAAAPPPPPPAVEGPGKFDKKIEEFRKRAEAGELAEKITQAAGRRKAKTGYSGTILTGPRGVTDPVTTTRRTLLTGS